MTYVQQVLTHLSSIGFGSLATLMGRYYAMDRDKRYERTKIAYEALTKGVGVSIPVEELIQVCGVTDIAMEVKCLISNWGLNI